MCSRSTVLVQYLYGYKPDKYRTNTGQVPDNDGRISFVRAKEEYGSSMRRVWVEYGKDV